jgi:Ribbon-helix-helix protein, copG family
MVARVDRADGPGGRRRVRFPSAVRANISATGGQILPDLIAESRQMRVFGSGRLSADAVLGLPRYHGISLEVKMTDMLIRDVPDDVVAAVDAHAARLGLSRSEYVRRRLAQDAAVPGSAVTVQDLARFAEVFGDLDDPNVMSRAWE